VLDGFWLDIKIFVIVEVAVLELGLVVAVARSTRTPALFPVRLLGATYTDIFRGIPTILCVYLIGFGVPALELSGVPTDPVVLGGIALTLSYSAYVAEVYRAGIDSIHAGQRSAALALMGFARDVADEVCFLHEGRIHERGEPARVLSAPQQPETQRFLRRLLEAGRV
jgi:polar amino acid transport system permease protein